MYERRVSTPKLSLNLPVRAPSGTGAKPVMNDDRRKPDETGRVMT